MELSNLTSLRDYGRDSLEKEFRQMLYAPFNLRVSLWSPHKDSNYEDKNNKLQLLNAQSLALSSYLFLHKRTSEPEIGEKSLGNLERTQEASGVNTPTRKGTGKRKELCRAPSKSEHGHSRRGSSMPSESGGIIKEEEEEIYGENYIVFCKSLLRLIQSERELMKSIIPEQSQSTIFDKLIQAAMDIFISEGEETFHMTQGQFPTLIHSMEATHGPDNHSNMPSDGTVHELTRNIEFQLCKLDYDTGEGTSAWGIRLNLELKARVYEAPTLSSLFLLNNYNYIVKALQRSGLLALLQEGGIAEVEKQYQELINEHKTTYQKCWSKVLNFLLEMDKPILSQKGWDEQTKLKDKQRQLIKDKFKGFNTEFDELHQIQKTYAVPDTQLRDQLRNKNIDLILPLYTSFIEKYRNLHFTKNPEKYIKYTAEEVEAKLNTFFDVSA
ncbi:exocyst complex component 7-like [Montipora foliosa]|uniref:exocyst complex component 7-like n=1 Tax=Montipora foliosa TaxID=591990 RepID=UPI0035F1E5C3